MKTLVLILCLVPAVAFALTEIKFKDGSKMCGNYLEKGAAYCRNMDGGEVCMEKKDMVSVNTVSECIDNEMNGDVSAYLKQHNLSHQDRLAKKNAREQTGGSPEWEWKAPAKKKKAVREDSGW